MDAADWTGLSQWRTGPTLQEKENPNKGERRGAEEGDGRLQRGTTTETPLSPGLYPTTPLNQAPARPIPHPPHHLSLSLSPRWDKLTQFSFEVGEKCTCVVTVN